jgi:kynureninase
VRWLSALDLAAKPRLVTTSGEFHAIRRQLARLAEWGIDVHREPAEPIATLAERLAAAADERTAAVLVSAVYFETARIVPGLGELARSCAHRGIPLLVDAYHALGALPFSLRAQGLESALVTGGGYKYLQLGEGNAFLRLPRGLDLRPVVTGWFAEFEAKSKPRSWERVEYGAGAAAFGGATYDPASQYRGARVFDFFVEQRLTPELLREVSQHQVGRLAERFDALDLPPAVVTRNRAVPLAGLGAFLAFEGPHAVALQRALLARGVFTDARGRYLRFGPAPYLRDDQLDAAIDALGDAARELG